jgi:hypothetical protein
MKYPVVLTSFDFAGQTGTNALNVVPKHHRGLLHEATFIVGSVIAKYLSQPELYLRVPAVL